MTALCELSIQGSDDMQGLLDLSCSARTCEVYEQKDSESCSYVTTIRGKPASGTFAHSIPLPAAKKVIVRLLSLQQQGKVSIHSVQLNPIAPEDSQSLARPHSESASCASNFEAGSRSQQAEVKAMLQGLIATG